MASQGSAWPLLALLCVATLAGDVAAPSTTTPAPPPQGDTTPSSPFRFTRDAYNVSIPENSLPKTYAEASDDNQERMGVEIPTADRELDVSVKFKILAGDKDRFFKAEERRVGDFWFLALRTRTDKKDVLNRERNDRYYLDVRATKTWRERGGVGGPLQRHADARVTVRVLDTNDLKPLFYPTEYDVTVPEDLAPHRSVAQVLAEDADLGVDGEIYYSLEASDQFAVHPVTGVVTLTRPLRYSARSLHELTVRAQDRGALLRHGAATPAATAKLRVRVRQVNMFAPEIAVRHLPDIAERSVADVYAIVTVTDKDAGVHGQIRAVDIVDGDPDGHFRVRPVPDKPSEFAVAVVALLDREAAPRGYNLTLRAKDAGTPPRETYRVVPVRLTDVNDNAPVFDREVYEVNVAETAPINSPLIKLKVSDADEGKNAQVLLEIVGGNEGGEFRVQPDTGVLYTAVALDFEAKALYTLTVAAVDQGNAGSRKQSSAKVKVAVLDANDNDPVFEVPNGTDAVWVDENEPVGTVVTKVTARDRDAGENAYVSYSIANLRATPFEVDPFTGVVRTAAVLDFEGASRRREFTLRIRASDWGLPYRRQTETTLRVRVRDVNDNRPQFEKVDCRGRVHRDVAAGTELLALSAVDFDAGDVVTYKLVGGAADGCFALDATSGVLSVTCDLRRSGDVTERKLNVTATDGTHFSDVATIVIELVDGGAVPTPTERFLTDAGETRGFECVDTGVTRSLTEMLRNAERTSDDDDDEDDFAMMPSRYGDNVHAPEIMALPEKLSVAESAAPGTTLIRVRARDRDLGYNGKLVYGVSAGDVDSVFRMDADSGELRLWGPLDRERRPRYTLNVTVSDLGRPQKSVWAEVIVDVLDVNDNAPRFDKSVSSFRVTEDALRGTVVVQLRATDADEGANGEVRYKLLTDTDDFTVNAATGTLTVAATLDRETHDVYELRVAASDRTGTPPCLTSEALVRVTIDDVNDNAPRFAHYGAGVVTVKVREDVPVGTVVATLDAADPDLGAGGQVVYSLVVGAGGDIDADAPFLVDRLSGTLRVAAPLDFEERQLHTVVVRARDRGTPPLSSTATVVVEVVDVDENLHAPRFDDFVAVATILENQPSETLVTTVKASDADAKGDSSKVSYSIRGGDGLGLFTIDQQGRIRTTAPLDAESKSRYWLKVFAQDHGVVPLHSKIEVMVEVLNENDNVPLTVQPAYYPSVAENSPAGKVVLRLSASDPDKDTKQKISYRISAGNPDNFFTIDSSSGIIKTTGRRLDRENQAEHILEVTVMDNGNPPLSSTTRVVVSVTDVNDHAPEFTEQALYKINIPESVGKDIPLFQNETEELDVGVPDLFLENATWETFNPDDLLGQPVFRILGFDLDEGVNGELEYSIKTGRGAGKFKIHPKTGVVYSQRDFQEGQEYDLRIRAQDGGNPVRSHSTRVSVLVLRVPKTSENCPQIINPNQSVEITENDGVGFLVALIQAEDVDGDTLWFQIEEGDEWNEFFIGRDEGNVLLARKLDWERKNMYNLTISITDGVHTVYTQLYVSVLDINEHNPQFSQEVYSVDISENVAKDTEVVQLLATDEDEDKRMIYSLLSARDPASLSIFKVDSLTGLVTLIEQLDRETIEEHVLTVMAKDLDTPSRRGYARVFINVHDHNDHQPEFTSQLIQGKVFETASIGTAVVQVYAIDRDRGDNSCITYSITSGNIGNVFSIDPSLGTISLAKELNLSSTSEYMLIVKAADNGSPSLSTTIPVHIMVTMADNAPPRFLTQENAAEIFENQVVGTYVKHLEARSTSSLLFDIIEGNESDMFFINPTTGVVITKKVLDYEQNKFYNLTIEATNMAGTKAHCFVTIHVLDRNDNAPMFLQPLYQGSISEAAPTSSLIISSTGEPLVIAAQDKDSEINAQLLYEIIEIVPRNFFDIDSTTGAIKTIKNLDFEEVAEFHFHVKVSDLGKPQLSCETTAEVEIHILDINDNAPQYQYSEYNVSVLLPTYENIVVIQVNATDPDLVNSAGLVYDIVSGNSDKTFAINMTSGTITISNVEGIKSFHQLQVRVSDGEFSNMVPVNIYVERTENSGLKFDRDVYVGSVLENSTKIMNVVMVNVLGNALNEHIEFRILNPSDMFEIGLTSGAIKTTGNRFDREAIDRYKLIVEACSTLANEGRSRVAHVSVNVTVLDINDNCPMFMSLPYHTVLSVDAQKGDTITKVHAIDVDKGENGEITYELAKGHGELFKVGRKSGEVTLKQTLEGHSREYELVIRAYDGGTTRCSTEAPVHIKVIDRSVPVFEKQFYFDSIPENVEIHTPLSVSITAESPLDRKLIYSIIKGNDFEEFALDFNTAPDSSNGPCVIYVIDELDYEHKKQYDLTVAATDSVSGVQSETLVRISIQDVNDCPPEFSKDSYNISLPETSPIGTMVLKVIARDNDTGANKKIHYEIMNEGNNSTQFFHINLEDGSIFLMSPLDHETQRVHHITVVASDLGVPSLSSTAHIWIKVIDMNDNAPKFEQNSYTCFLTQDAHRGQFVTMVMASDPDEVDEDGLTYSIVGGNKQQVYSINPAIGIIYLTNLQNFGHKLEYVLNVSVTDKVYTAFTRVRIVILPTNRHNPTFPKIQFEVKVLENQPPGTLVTKVTASDNDFGKYKDLTYSLPSSALAEIFLVNKTTGDIFTKRLLDREERKLYELQVMAMDGGGRSGFVNVRVKVGDVNDHAPKFLLQEYKACIQSNLTINSPFKKVKAEDADEDMAAEIEYSIYETESSGINELFQIDKQEGTIMLMKSAMQWENQVFQFFVRAQDLGNPPLHSDVPVDVFVIGSQDTAPIFEHKDDSFFLMENSLPGTIITQLKMATDILVHYRIVSGNEDQPLFTIDDSGQLILSRPLDREEQDVHIIAVLAETESSPPLTALTEVTLNVLDENDHAPEFETDPYKITLAENVEEGTSFLKVMATDRDIGTNSEIRYSFGPDIGNLANMFSIEANTGWLTTLVPLDKEKQSEFVFQVIASDSGNPKQFSRTHVYLKLHDYNDNAPIFTSHFYEAAVNEDALPGTIILQLTTTDNDEDDTNAYLEFYITSGDPRSQFHIRSTGEIYVAKPLDRETTSKYMLNVTVTDGKFIAVTSVSIDILDANDNPPYCKHYRYQKIVSEGTHPGTYILSVMATDADEEPNAKLRYYLSGVGAEHFLIEKTAGHVKTVRALDREERSKFQLVAHVQDRDRPEWQCSSQLEIIVSDLNDNKPEFSMESYRATLAEDMEVGSLVTKVHANDKDLGINRKIKYYFSDSAEGHFEIAIDSGIVTLVKPLDRETQSRYNLSVRAIDQGTPQLSSEVALVVHVLDINDNPPEFASKYYATTISEVASVGTDIVHILATSKDIGINADISYSIVGGNEHQKFEIHPKTGIVTIVEQLDFERAKDYFLTIQAVDGGTPPLSNYATVNVSVADSNDNTPIFIQASYSSTIREDAQIGDKIIQVIANDLDSALNGKVSYSIEKGDRQRQFAIDENSGYISVAAALDREMVSNYVLEVSAKDNGLPILSSSVMLNIEISDANDNAPLFSQSNYSTVIQEDKQPRFAIVKFDVTDADAAPNASPFTFDIPSGNEGSVFMLEKDGILRTAARLSHKVKDFYLLHIRVFDNGTPPLFSDAWVSIKVIEESQYPPSITPLEIYVNSYMDEFPGGNIGRIHAFDQDQYDILSYSLVKLSRGDNGAMSSASELFEIDSKNGILVALPRLDVGEYSVNVSVSDGKFTSYAIVKVLVDLVSDEMLESAIVIRFRDVTPLDFVLSHRRGFLRAVRNALGVRLRDVVIISIQSSEDTGSEKRRVNRQVTNSSCDLDVLFAVQKHSPMGPGPRFHSANFVRNAVREHLEELESSANLVVEEIVRDKCNSNLCSYGKCEDHIVLDTNALTPIATDVTSFVSPKYLRKVHCSCKEGYAGDQCEIVVNECAREPCPLFKDCIPDASVQRFSCQCPKGFTGPSCEIDISKCHDGSCYVPQNPVSFSGKSYVQYRIGKHSLKKSGAEDHLGLSLRLRTVQATGNLMYAAGQIDYNILEIVNGVVQYRFDLGSGEGMVRVSSVSVSDGSWHEVKLQRDKNSAQLTVDTKHAAQGSAPGVNDVTGLQPDDDHQLFLGAEVRQLGYEDVRRGFVGCLDDVRINGASVPLHVGSVSSVAFLKRIANVEFSCDVDKVLASPGVCGSQPCKNGGTCQDLGGGSYQCHCGEEQRFAGHLCEVDTDPCASAPCLFGGRCRESPAGNDFLCECPARLTGKRCEYGKLCDPNPCRNGGECEEEGLGSYSCLCPPNTTGLHCESGLYPPPISSSANNVTLYESIIIIVAIVATIILVAIFILYRKLRVKRSHRRAALNINNETHKDVVVLNCSRPTTDDFKRASKLSNLEVTQVPPQCPPRPLSYTPSSNNEPSSYGHHHQTATAVFNNLDTLRSYGSAGDELENVPPDYLRNLNRMTPTPVLSSHPEGDNLHKPSWTTGMTDQINSYTDSNKIKNDLKSSISPDISKALPATVGRAGRCGLDEDPKILGGYHWDCSDWVNRSQNPLPNITEVPGSEVPDSSSFHSNESNESNTHHGSLPLPTVNGIVDPVRDIETLNEDQESEYVAGSECGTDFGDMNFPESPNMQAFSLLENGLDDYNFKVSKDYLCHPNTYLPHYANSDTETEALNIMNPDEENIESYGFPSLKHRLVDGEGDSVITALGERTSLLGTFTSNSDLSTNFCDIEDSEFESLDLKKRGQKKRPIPPGIMQTSV